MAYTIEERTAIDVAEADLKAYEDIGPLDYDDPIRDRLEEVVDGAICYADSNEIDRTWQEFADKFRPIYGPYGTHRKA